MSYATSGIVGATFSKRTTDPEFALGETVIGNADTIWVYVVADEVVATGTCTVTTSDFGLTDTAGNHTADTAFASGEYGWVRQTAKLSA